MKKQIRNALAAVLMAVGSAAFSIGAFADMPLGIVKVTSNSLNVRKNPDATSELVGHLSKDKQVDYVGETTEYYQILWAESENGFGYVNKNYVVFVDRYSSLTPKKAEVTASVVNVRAGADASAARVGSVTKGKVISYYGEENGFLKFWMDDADRWGYVDKSFTGPVTEQKPSSDPASPETKPGGNSSGGSSSAEVKKGPAAGSALDGIYKVKVQGVSNAQTGEVICTKVPKTAKSVTIPDTIEFENITYKVTAVAAGASKGNSKITKVVIGKNVKSIGKNAFSGCGKLKSVTIKTTALTAKNVGASAFKGIHANAAIKVPASKLKAYRTLLKKKGVNGPAQKIVKG